jgi:hypothetical protein
MKMATNVATLVLSAVGVSCWANTIQDPLHGYCAGLAQCADNATNSPTSFNPPVDFGFTVNGGPLSGDLLLDILVPNNEQDQSSYSVTGTFSGTATLFSATDWSSGNLDAFLGISASPTNPIGAFLPSTQALVPLASGFSVYQLDAGTQTLQGVSNPDVTPLLNLGSTIPLGSYIVGFLNEGTSTSPDWVATANGGAIFETSPAPPVPEPSTIILLGSGILGVAALLKKAQSR